MSINKIGEQALQKYDEQIANSPVKLKKKTLNEDEYIEVSNYPDKKI